MLDCPGVVVEARGELESALKGMVKAEDVKDPKGPGTHLSSHKLYRKVTYLVLGLIVEIILQRCQQTHLQMLYNIPAFSDTRSFLLEVARAKGRIRKGGVPDLDGAARSILRDWVQGRIPYYTSPPSAASTQAVKEANEQKQLENVTDTDVDSAQILTTFAPAFDLAALFGEADAVAFGEGGAGSSVQGKKAVKMQDGAMGMESDDADVGWAAEEPEEIEMEEDDEDDLNLDDLVDDDEMEDDDDEEEEEDVPRLVEAAPTPVTKTKRSAHSQIVSVAPPSKKSKSVSFSAKPLGPTGSTAVNASTSNAKEIISAGVDEVGLNKANKKAAKKDKKKATKKANKAKGELEEATKEFGDDSEIPSKPRGARTVAATGISEAYDFGEFFGKKQAKQADDDDEEL